jgi:hypothetical protein
MVIKLKVALLERHRVMQCTPGATQSYQRSIFDEAAKVHCSGTSEATRMSSFYTKGSFLMHPYNYLLEDVCFSCRAALRPPVDFSFRVMTYWICANPIFWICGFF